MSGLNIFFVIAGVATFVGTGIACWQIRKQRPEGRDEGPIRTKLRASRPVRLSVPSRNSNFTGRSTLLDSLRRALVEGRWVGLTQVIAGLGGVGKTQLAIEYVHQYADEYWLIAWLRAEEAPALQTDMQALAEALSIPVDEGTRPECVVRAVHSELACREGWLLVFDNAEGPETLRPYLPERRKGHVLVTSRNPNWRSIVQPITVNVFEREESVAFLLKRTGRTDQDEANTVAEVLGDLPLALEQAAAYIEQTGSELAFYAREFDSRHTELWEDQIPPDTYHATISTTWCMALEKLTETLSSSADVLKLLSFLAAEDVPLFLLAEGSEGLPEPLSRVASDDIALKDAIADLRRYGLVDTALDSVSVHRLLQTVVRDGLDDEQRKLWISAALQMLLRVYRFSKDDPSTWERCERLLPHVPTAVGHAEGMGVADEVSAFLLWSAGAFVQVQANLPLAKEYLERAAAIDEAALGSRHPYVGRDLNSLATVLSDLGDLQGAEAAYHRALAISEEAAGPVSANAAIDLSNLALVLKDQGDLQGARSALERALDIHESMHNSDPSSVATATSNLGQVLEELGDLQGAKSAFERALSFFHKERGPEHPSTATVTANLGSVLHKIGDLHGSRLAYEQVLRIFEKTYGPEHPNVATATNNLASVLRDLGDLAAARSALERALQIDRTTYGPHHPSVATDLSNLGAVLHDLGDLKGARAAHERALEIDEHAFGAEHPTVAIRLNNLGTVLYSLGDLDGARSAFTRALKITEKVYGLEHPRTRLLRENLDALRRRDC